MARRVRDLAHRVDRELVRAFTHRIELLPGSAEVQFPR